MGPPWRKSAQHAVPVQADAMQREAGNCRGTLKVNTSRLCLAASPRGPVASLLMHCLYSLQVVLREALSWRLFRSCRDGTHVRVMCWLFQSGRHRAPAQILYATAHMLPMLPWLPSTIAAPVSVLTACSALTCQEEGVVSVPGWVLLGLKQCIKIPEAAGGSRN